MWLLSAWGSWCGSALASSQASWPPRGGPRPCQPRPHPQPSTRREAESVRASHTRALALALALAVDEDGEGHREQAVAWCKGGTNAPAKGDAALGKGPGEQCESASHLQAKAMTNLVTAKDRCREAITRCDIVQVTDLTHRSRRLRSEPAVQLRKEKIRSHWECPAPFHQL